MIDNSRAFAETVFERAQRREKEIKDALKLEAERHEATVKNMHRLRALRLQRDENNNAK
jgi:glycosylphosphatidylinositol transamidase (GPIT) subunit GPI8